MAGLGVINLLASSLTLFAYKHTHARTHAHTHTHTQGRSLEWEVIGVDAGIFVEGHTVGAGVSQFKCVLETVVDLNCIQSRLQNQVT